MSFALKILIVVLTVVSPVLSRAETAWTIHTNLFLLSTTSASLGFEVETWPHVGLGVAGVYSRNTQASGSLADLDQDYSGFLGLRFYSKKKLGGWFAGPRLGLVRQQVKFTTYIFQGIVNTEVVKTENIWFEYFYGAEAGYQFIFWKHLKLAGGVGAFGRSYSQSFNSTGRRKVNFVLMPIFQVGWLFGG